MSIQRILIPVLLTAVSLFGCAASKPTRHSTSGATVVRTNIRVDPAHPPMIGENYPTESRLLHEEGVCIVKIVVRADASIGEISLDRSTGYSRLDEACLKAFAAGGLLPATENGIPVTATAEIPITWKLSPK